MQWNLHSIQNTLKLKSLGLLSYFFIIIIIFFFWKRRSRYTFSL